MASKCWGG
ncbi:hypothetical protein VCCP1047_2951, partial [Vibrio cholerae CP1047(20)]